MTNRYSWCYLPAGRILVLAASFGIGPKVAAEHLVAGLGFLDPSETLIWKDAWDLGNVKVEVLINFGVVVAPNLNDVGIKIWIDCVDWLRTKIPTHIQEYDLMLCEEFFPSGEAVWRKHVDRWRRVRPIIAPIIRQPKSESLTLVSLGGISTPYSTYAHLIEMPAIFLSGLHEYYSSRADTHLEIYLPQYLIDALDMKNWKGVNCEIQPLDPGRFHRHLTICNRIICQPGLYTPFEAISANIPLALSFPMSFTQVRQAQRFAALGVPSCTSYPAANLRHQHSDIGDIEEIEREWFLESAFDWSDCPKPKVISRVVDFLEQCSWDSGRIALDFPSYLENALDIIRDKIGGSQ